MRPSIMLCLAPLAVLACACETTYHPEYHPVTVTQVSQHVSTPVIVTRGATSASPPVYVLAAPPATLVGVPSPPVPPPGFFDTHE